MYSGMQKVRMSTASTNIKVKRLRTTWNIIVTNEPKSGGYKMYTRESTERDDMRACIEVRVKMNDTGSTHADIQTPQLHCTLHIQSHF